MPSATTLGKWHLGDAHAFDANLGVFVVPDLAMVDVHLADDTSGLDASDHIGDRCSDVSIVFVTANPDQVPD